MNRETAVEYRFESRAVAIGCGENRHGDAIEREHVPAAPRRFDPLANSVDDRVEHFERLGWECLMVGGIVHWRPPAHLDPGRRPRRNTAHDLGRPESEVAA